MKDSQLSKKTQSQEYHFLIEYDTTSSRYLTTVPGFKTKINLSISKGGKLSLLGRDIKMDKCREWLITLLVHMKQIQEHYLKESRFHEYIMSSDELKKSPFVKHCKHKHTKDFLENLVAGICSIKDSGRNTFDLVSSLTLKNFFHLRDYSTILIDAHCEDEECNAPIICPDCNSTDFISKRIGNKQIITIECLKCGAEIKQDIEIECTEGHSQNRNPIEFIICMANNVTKKEINSIFQSKGIPFILNMNETILIKQKAIQIHVSDKKILYNWDELPSFTSITKVNELLDFEKEAQADHIISALERCKNRKKKCRSCTIVSKEPEQLCH